MKRTRNEQHEYDSIQFKKIHYDPITPKLKEEKKIYRCSYINCTYVACTPYNMSTHIKNHKIDTIK